MSYKYIPQENNINFVFPNNDTYEYDVDILHSLNDNSVSGTATNFSAITQTSSEISFSHDYTWSLNGAERFIVSNSLRILSVHVLTPSQTYYKPWRCIDRITTASTGITSTSGSNTVILTPTNMGVASFTSGTYYIEVRFIGLKSVYPVCASLQITIP